MKLKKLAMLTSASLLVFSGSSALAEEGALEDGLISALSNGKTSLNLRLRYEGVNQDNAIKDADALTLRTRLNYTSADYKGFSTQVEFEDTRVVAGVDDYNNSIGSGGDYSVIADPETTELDQALIQYKFDSLTTKLGRQVITLDNQRFVGDVGWRQDRQTFDALAFSYQLSDNLKLQYAYLNKRNRIFAEQKDIDSKDHLLNASYNSAIGKFTGYGYLLEEDNQTKNGIDTFGLSYAGSSAFAKTKVNYRLEGALQDIDSVTTSYATHYLLAELSALYSGFDFKVGYELLGSDNGEKGFATPLATLHKFNGWSDQFLNTPDQGLADLYASIGGKLAGGKWSVIYHKFDADNASATVDDLGSEVDAVYTRSFAKNYLAGIKYAAYFAGDAAAGKVDSDKLWVWAQVKF